MKVDKKQVLAIGALLFAILFFIVPPLFHQGMFVADDGNWMIIRFAAFYHALRAGQFPVRFLPQLNFGYGYPVPTFLYPGFMYLGVPFKAMGLTFTTTIKVLFGLSVLGFAVSTYLWLWQRFSRRTAYLATIVGLFTPYLLYDIYGRGSLGEVMAIAVVPFIFLMLERKQLLWTGIGIFLLLLFHNTLALLFLPLILLYGLLINKRHVTQFLVSFVLGGLSASFFTLPALFELNLTQFARTGISNPLNYFASSTLIGLAFLALLVAAWIKFLLAKEKPAYKNLIIFFLVIDTLSIFIASPLSRIIWSVVPSSFVQFPFRFLSIVPLSSAFLAAYILNEYKTRKEMIIPLIVLFFFIVLYSPLLLKHTYQDQPDGYYATNEATTTVKDEYMPVWVKVKPVVHSAEPVVVVNKGGTINNVVDSGNAISFQETADKDTTAQINTIYWPGWTATIDGKPLSIKYNNPAGVMQVRVPQGTHNIFLHFGETPFRLFADVLSAVAFLLLLFVGLSKNVRKRLGFE